LNENNFFSRRRFGTGIANSYINGRILNGYQARFLMGKLRKGTIRGG